MNDFSLVTNSNLMVCPMTTYVSPAIACYANPVIQMGVGIYPAYNSSTNTVDWVFSSNETVLLSQSAYSQILVQWTINDKFISKVAQNQASANEMRIAGHAFREESVYQFGLNITNYDRTFSSFY